MPIENPSFQPSHADKCRAAELKWRGAPPGIPPAMADEFMARLKAGSTVRKLTGGGKLGSALIATGRFKKHCEMHPEWAAEAWRISKMNEHIGKGALRRNLTHCKYMAILSRVKIFTLRQVEQSENVVCV